MVLIYPLVSYQDDFWIYDNYDEEEKNFKKEIEDKKAELLKKVKGNKKIFNFNMVSDCYYPLVKDFV